MKQEKPKLIAPSVPWSISTAAPHLKLHQTAEGNPSSLTFIGYFKVNDRMESHNGSSVEVVKDPGEFRQSSNADEAPYRMVRLVFSGGVAFRKSFAVSDHEVIPEASYDWSAVPGFLRAGEDALTNLRRTESYWLATGHSPDPGYYEVQNSPWINALGINDPELRHYIAIGQDEYYEIIARSWDWEVGQQA
jgi:hypothetical protein